MKLTIHTIIDLLHSDPAGVSEKFGIPLSTVYSWCNSSRKPPKYVIIMMLWIIELQQELDKRSIENGNEENRLAEEVRGAGQGE